MTVRSLATDVLVVVISGGRPDPAKRKTERFQVDRGLRIISNNSAGYETPLPIIDVPPDFRDYYEQHHSLSPFGMTVPLNRSYAIRYAREQHYRYLVELDDNIHTFAMTWLDERRGRYYRSFRDITPVMNALADVLRYTNAGMSGIQLGALPPEPYTRILAERYVYSVLALDLEVVPYFFGDVEEDIAMRYDLARRRIPVAQIVPFRYSKIGQKSSGDRSGNRGMYDELGTGRGATMAKVFGEWYSRGESNLIHNVSRERPRRSTTSQFMHHVKPFRVGLRTSDNTALRDALTAAFREVEDGS